MAHYDVSLPAGIRTDDAMREILDALGEALAAPGSSTQSVFINVSYVVEKRLRSDFRDQMRQWQDQDHSAFIDIKHDVNAEPYWEAFHELTRRGILFPGCGKREKVQASTAQYFLTQAGRQWIGSGEGLLPAATPLQPDRFCEMLRKAAPPRFQYAFLGWADEAMGCYRFCNYRAACAMAGAAAEALLLAIAVERCGDETEVERRARSKEGMGQIRKLVAADQDATTQAQIDICFELLRHWRNSAAHPLEAPLGETEAFVALGTLLRVATFAQTHWPAITKPRRFNGQASHTQRT